MTTRHNACPNPAAGVDLTGWTGSSCAPVRATGLTGLPRTTGVKSTATGYFHTATAACAPGQTFTVSFYLLNNSGSFQFGHTVYISYTRSGGGDTFPQTFSTPSVADGSSVRCSFTTNPASAPADVTGIYLIIDTMPANITVTGVLLEQGSTLDTYFDGTFPDASWDGTADLSPSSRTYTLETISWGSPPTLLDAQDGTQDYTLGLSFSLTAGGYCYGLEWNPTPNSNTPVPPGGCIAQLWNLDASTELARVAFTQNPGNVSQRVYFDKQPALTTGVNWGVTVYTVRYVYKSFSGWTVPSPSGKIRGDKGRLAVGAGSGPFFPNQLQDALYYVAPLMSFGAAPAAPTASLWTGSAEVPLTVHLWDGATEVPLTIDSII